MSPKPVATVSISYWGCGSYVRQAVESILAQTDPRLIVVVINDGDLKDPPETHLSGIGDPRLVLFDSPVNRGPYWNHEVALRASSTPFLLIQDADDTSHPTRLAKLLAAIGDAPFAASQLGGQYYGAANSSANRRLGPTHQHRYSHASLHCVRDLLDLGGYYLGHRVASDTLIMNTQALIGEMRGTPCRTVEEKLYVLRSRADSLMHAPGTRLGSSYRQKLWSIYGKAWKQLWEAQRAPDLVPRARELLFAHVTADERRQILEMAKNLQAKLERALQEAV